MNRYLGPEFPQILSKNNVEYKQANLAVPSLSTRFPSPLFFFFETLAFLPAIVSSAFDPPDGQEPYSLVFDLTGDIAYDRPDMVRQSFPYASL
jgi:hypothetical protein